MCCSLGQNFDDFLWRDPNLGSLRSSMDYCSTCTRSQTLMFWWDTRTFTGTCCPSTTMTIITKQFLQPILSSGFSFREKVRALEECESSVHPVAVWCMEEKTLQSYFFMSNSVIIMSHERYSQLVSLARASSGNLFKLCDILLIFSWVKVKLNL